MGDIFARGASIPLFAFGFKRAISLEQNAGWAKSQIHFVQAAQIQRHAPVRLGFGE